jgi:peptidoglycan hydrolase CwlO-like protein
MLTCSRTRESGVRIGVYDQVLNAQQAEYDGLLEASQRHINHLETEVNNLRSQIESVQSSFDRYRRNPMVRVTHRLTTLFGHNSRRR